MVMTKKLVYSFPADATLSIWINFGFVFRVPLSFEVLGCPVGV